MSAARNGDSGTNRERRSSCPRCHHENPAHAKFCLECGARLAIACADCGTELPAGAKFCLECGRAAAPSQIANPAAYTPKHLAEKILQSRGALEGERKQVTVLFADVKGSMELSAELDPEAWHRIMDRFFAILSDGIHRFEGTINQYTGDGVMALFGAPIAHEDHAQRACYTALTVGAELRRYAGELRLSEGVNFSVRMGINSGEVVVGKIGNDLRMDYTAQGHTVGLAARMEQIAAPDRVCLTPATAELVDGFFELRDLGEARIKGVQEPIHVYELQGVGRLHTRLDVSKARGLSTFVGRERESALLDDALERALEGNGQFVGIVGEAGLGKSRLCYEFAERCRARGLVVREAHALSHGKMIPFLPVLELVRGYFGITEHDRDEDARRKIAGAMVLADRELEDKIPLIFDFLGVADPEHASPRAGVEGRPRDLFRIIRTVLRGRNRQEPAVFLFEDLHWFDAGSEAFLAEFADALAGTRMLVLSTFRPEFHAAWMQKTVYRQVPLLPLGPGAIRELLTDLLGHDPSLGNLAEMIQAGGVGNPFFSEEVVQSLAESGALVGRRGSYRLVHAVESLTIPSTVQAVLAARIDRLLDRQKQVLQTAAVIGRRFVEPVLAAVLELPESELASLLRFLEGSEFIYEESLYPEAEFSFKHPLTQEVAYRSQLTKRRGTLHRAVARAIAARYPDKLDEQAALLAHHWEQSGEPLEAARWHARAADWTGWRDISGALRHWQRVRTLLNGAPPSAESMSLGLASRLWTVVLGGRLGLSEAEIDALVAEGVSLAEQTGNLVMHSRLLLTQGTARVFAGKLDEGLARHVAGRDLAERSGDPRLRVIARNCLAYGHRVGGQLTNGLRFVEEALELTGGDVELGTTVFGGRSPYVTGLGFKGWILLEMGRIDEAIQEAERGLQLALARREEENVTITSTVLCLAAWWRGEPALAMGHARRALEHAEHSGNLHSRIAALADLGLAHAMSESPQQSVDAFQAALRAMRERRTGLDFEPLVLTHLAHALIDAGRFADGEACTGEAVESSRSRAMRSSEVGALLAHARALRGSGRESATVASALGRARALLHETGARFHAPFLNIEEAELAALERDGRRRADALQEAHALFTAFGASLRADAVAGRLSS